MSTWLSKITTNNAQPQTLFQQTPTTALSPLVGSIVEQPRVRDPNAPDYRLQINQRCIYERRLPGDAYITAHVQRLQSGYYDTPQTHEDAVLNVRFVSITFVFHPSRRINRFTSADISIALHKNPDEQQYQPDVDFKKPFGRGLKPRFLKHAPHLLYGAISPETLNWNFNVAGSLGVSQTPVSASLAPSGGMKGSYKLYDMMKIQGSVRSLRSWQGREYDLEDGEMVWTLEENGLQKSGLPREFTFVMLITKGDAENVMFDVEIKPTVGSWFGHFPRWYTSLAPYKPIHTQDMDLDEEVGQRFEPTEGNAGFNFATLAGGFDDFVSLPGTTYSTTVSHRNSTHSSDDADLFFRTIRRLLRPKLRCKRTPVSPVSNNPSSNHRRAEGHLLRKITLSTFVSISMEHVVVRLQDSRLRLIIYP